MGEPGGDRKLQLPHRGTAQPTGVSLIHLPGGSPSKADHSPQRESPQRTGLGVHLCQCMGYLTSRERLGLMPKGSLPAGQWKGGSLSFPLPCCPPYCQTRGSAWKAQLVRASALPEEGLPGSRQVPRPVRPWRMRRLHRTPGWGGGLPVQSLQQQTPGAERPLPSPGSPS